MDDDKCTRANGQRAARRPRAARPLHTPRARRDRQAAPQFRVPPQAAQPAQAGLPGLRRVRDSPRLAPETQEEVRRSGAQEAGHRRPEEEQEEVRLGLRRRRQNRRDLQARGYAIHG